MDINTFNSLNTLTLEDYDEDGFQRRSYRVKNYILRKYRDRHPKFYFIITGSVGAFLLFLVVGIILSKITKVTNTDEIRRDAVELILSGKSRLSTFTLETRKFSCCKRSWNGVFEPYEKSKYFWFQRSGSQIFINSSQELLVNSTSHISVLFNDSRVSVQDVAYDHAGNNLYVIDNSTGALIAIDVRTGYHDILLTDLIRPHHIEVDSLFHFVFILQISHSIVKSSMDGKFIMKVVEGNHLKVMTLDHKTQRIYWTNENEKGIESSDYEGKNRYLFPVDTAGIYDLAVVNNELFWLLEQEIDDVVTHHLISCVVKDYFCTNHSMQEIHMLGGSATITVMQLVHNDNFLVKDNVCKMNNSDCEHLCFLSSEGGHTCACKLGWQLNTDNKTCRKVKEFMLYTLGSYFRGRILDFDRHNSVDVIWPSRFEAEKHRHFSGWDVIFEYDQTNDFLYFTDNINIYAMKLRSNSSKQKVLLKGNGDNDIKDIAYDWFTGNLYYIENNYLDHYKIKVVNIKMGSNYIKTLIDHAPGSGNDDEQNLVHAPSLAFHAGLGYLFYLNHGNQNAFIRKLTANGSEVLKILDEDYSSTIETKSLALDYIDQKVYWIHHDYDAGVKSTNFNGSEAKALKLYVPNLIINIDIYGEWMYLSTIYKIWRVSKVTGNGLENSAPLVKGEWERSRITGVKIVSDSFIKFQDGQEHPCDNRANGGCEQFCFMYDSETICECRDGENLNSDGYCHRKESRNSI